MKRSRLFVVAFLIVAVEIGAEQPPLSVRDRLTFTHVGPVKIGMTLAELRVAIGRNLYLEEELTEGCRYAAPISETLPISFMLIDGVVARFDVGEIGFLTRSGAGVGDSEQRIRSLYRDRLTEEANTYIDGGHYMKIESEDHRFSLVFETDGKVVTAIRVGRLPEALYIEGCL